ncbi:MULTISPECIES: hypothetical protein [unclassified Paenibacillus]|uniref:hypothetical protein n=1 Tax=unclassified Paenibacillus TaxID=185978 RepID=UPI0009A6065C|nr:MULTISPECIES: hypothetical protein [unclassified Paenibacillus]SOC63643.1 hypothetical protein SAMN05880581_1011045 [Paenibacillus sp. RU26A]SOC68547.1 hypothetical protein SAMN05880586_1011044 [Paenibacillus sp. RU5M]
MYTVTVEITQDRRNKLLEWIASQENATGDYNKGLLAGLRWTIDTIGVKEHLYSEVAETSSILINQDFINECTEKFEENWIDEGWNSGFALSIIAVLDLFEIQVVEFPTPKRTNKSLN